MIVWCSVSQDEWNDVVLLFLLQNNSNYKTETFVNKSVPSIFWEYKFPVTQNLFTQSTPVVDCLIFTYYCYWYSQFYLHKINEV